ncbi:hypothetical protein CYMTET_21406 [Cymbomonas tetramitiformis]|uniref:Photosynthesis system II assembly factor Ycf48/Hcf136-like domain-containing protein n=1 Tax=Cymbomonas tetramitiformis TaxID=36881 RepID=A0AAE0L2W7_9CHLO|nr:hypothetical protein CYMTET_21406 [Cymbomonas tetramitiformis]
MNALLQGYQCLRLVFIIAFPALVTSKSWVPFDTEVDVRLHGISFPTSEDGWAAGESNTVLHTSDGGLSWEPQNTSFSTSQTWLSVSFAKHSRTGWLVGDAGQVVCTKDGGSTWSAQESSVTDTLNSVQAVDENTVFAVGARGALVRTIDGGANWAEPEAVRSTSQDLFGLSFANGLVGWAVGSYGLVRHTQDGGSSWATQLSHTHSNLNAIDMVFTGLVYSGWAVGDTGHIIYTEDGGETWEVQKGCSEWYWVEELCPPPPPTPPPPGTPPLRCPGGIVNRSGSLPPLPSRSVASPPPLPPPFHHQSLHSAVSTPSTSHHHHHLYLPLPSPLPHHLPHQASPPPPFLSVSPSPTSTTFTSPSSFATSLPPPPPPQPPAITSSTPTAHPIPSCSTPKPSPPPPPAPPPAAPPLSAFAVGQAHDAVCFTIDGGAVFEEESQIKNGRALWAIEWKDEWSGDLVAAGEHGQIIIYRPAVLAAVESLFCWFGPHPPFRHPLHHLLHPHLPHRSLPSPPPPPPAGLLFSVQFDGPGTVPAAAGDRGRGGNLSLWASRQPCSLGGPHYLLDARYGNLEGRFASGEPGCPACNIGLAWTTVYVDGARVNASWDFIPVDAWFHLHVESTARFSDDITLMTRVAFGSNSAPLGSLDSHVGFLKGGLAEAYFWREYLLLAHVQVLAEGFDQTYPGGFLAAHYALEEGSGPYVYELSTLCERSSIQPPPPHGPPLAPPSPTLPPPPPAPPSAPFTKQPSTILFTSSFALTPTHLPALPSTFTISTSHKVNGLTTSISNHLIRIPRSRKQSSIQ